MPPPDRAAGRRLRQAAAGPSPARSGARAAAPPEQVSFPAVSHYALGLPGPDMQAGFPEAAARLRAAHERLGARALEVALERDPSLRERLGEAGLRQLLRDTEVYLDRIARAVAAADPGQVRGWADWVAPVYRRRRVPMDDLVTLTEGLRSAVATVVTPEEQAIVETALDEAIATFRWYRRLGGDARRRNRVLAALYKGG